jgi:hypothetical protein
MQGVDALSPIDEVHARPGPMHEVDAEPSPGEYMREVGVAVVVTETGPLGV